MSDKPWQEDRASDSSRDGPMTRTHSHIRLGIAVSLQINNSLCFYFTSQPGQAVFTSLHWLLLLLLWAHTHSLEKGGGGGTQIFAPKSGQRTVPKHTCPPCTLGSFRFGIPIVVAESQSQPQSEFEVRGSLSLYVSLCLSFSHCCNYRWAHVA